MLPRRGAVPARNRITTFSDFGLDSNSRKFPLSGVQSEIHSGIVESRNWIDHCDEAFWMGGRMFIDNFLLHSTSNIRGNPI